MANERGDVPRVAVGGADTEGEGGRYAAHDYPDIEDDPAVGRAASVEEEVRGCVGGSVEWLVRTIVVQSEGSDFADSPLFRHQGVRLRVMDGPQFASLATREALEGVDVVAVVGSGAFGCPGGAECVERLLDWYGDGAGALLFMGGSLEGELGRRFAAILDVFRAPECIEMSSVTACGGLDEECEALLTTPLRVLDSEEALAVTPTVSEWEPRGEGIVLAGNRGGAYLVVGARAALVALGANRGAAEDRLLVNLFIALPNLRQRQASGR